MLGWDTDALGGRLVYGRVFALMHSIEKHVDDTSLSTARDLMVSFFCFDEAWRDVRFLRTICCGTTTALDEVDLCVRPSEMWVLEADRILYFGPYREPAALICDDRRMDGGRMNTVFWLLMHGFQHSAVHYLIQVQYACLGMRDSSFLMRACLSSDFTPAHSPKEHLLGPEHHVFCLDVEEDFARAQGQFAQGEGGVLPDDPAKFGAAGGWGMLPDASWRLGDM